MGAEFSIEQETQNQTGPTFIASACDCQWTATLSWDATCRTEHVPCTFAGSLRPNMRERSISDDISTRKSRYCTCSLAREMITALMQSLLGLLSLELSRHGVCPRSMLIKLCGNADKNSIHKNREDPTFKQTLKKSLQELQHSKQQEKTEALAPNNRKDVPHDGLRTVRESDHRDYGSAVNVLDVFALENISALVQFTTVDSVLPEKQVSFFQSRVQRQAALLAKRVLGRTTNLSLNLYSPCELELKPV